MEPEFDSDAIARHIARAFRKAHSLGGTTFALIGFAVPWRRGGCSFAPGPSKLASAGSVQRKQSGAIALLPPCADAGPKEWGWRT